MSSNSLTQAAIERSAAEAGLSAARDTIAEAREKLVAAEAALLASALGSKDEEIRGAAEALEYCNGEIEKKVEGERGDRALKLMLREASGSLRAAARSGGDVKYASSALSEIEDELLEMRKELKELKRARREADRKLRKLLDATF